MRLCPQTKGNAFTIVALELDNDSCPAIEYLRDLQARDEDSHRTMLRKIKYRADQKLITNKMTSRPLVGSRYHGLHRLVSKSERLIYCYMRGNRVVLLNGYNKNDNEKAAYERGLQHKLDLVAWLAKGGQP